MKKTLQLLLLLVLGLSFNTYATHDIGGSLTYVSIAPNTYVFTYSHYNWGGVTPAGPNFSMVVSSPNCSNSRVIPLTHQTTIHGGYIPPTHGLTSYKISNFTGIVNFTSAEVACSSILATVQIGQGQPAANLSFGSSILQVASATLKLIPGQNLNSPIFDYRNEPVLVANKFQPITLSVAANDLDGDSLVYSLVAPGTHNNQPVAYATFNATQANPDPQPPYSSTSPQYAVLTAPTIYSPTFPLLSYTTQWSQMVNPAAKYFNLDAHSGALSFTPMLYSTNNIYLVSFRVDEYRKINGAYINIGSIRRETIIIVADGGSNINPRLTNIQTNIPLGLLDTIVEVRPGQQFVVQADGFDANANDSVYLLSDAATRLPGATFTTSTAKHQSATITWTPTASQVGLVPYHFRIWVRDNAQPLAARRVETFTVYVRNNGVTGTKPEMAIGNFKAYPNPFQQEVTFSLPENTKASEVIIYNILGKQIERLPVTSANAKNADLRWGNAAKYPTGTYIAKLISPEKIMQTVKFIKLN